MGESPKAEISVSCPELESFSVETPGGRIHIRWDNKASATPNAQLAFFAEFLATAGLYESWVSSCPLTYSSGIASHKRTSLAPGSCRFSPGTTATRISPACVATGLVRRFLG